MSGEQVVVAIFFAVLAGVLGYVFGYMQGGTDKVRQQNDLAFALRQTEQEGKE